MLRAQTTITPFTLKIEVTSFQHDPRGEPHRRQTIALRSDGSRSTTETILGKIGLEAGETKRTIGFIDGRGVTYFLSLGVKSTMRPLGQAAVEGLKTRLLNPPENCLGPGFTLLGNDTLEGQRVAIVTHTSDDLGWKLTNWEAPQLACQRLSYLSYDKQPDGAFKLQIESKAVKLELGEPDPALFEELPDYREMKPSDVQRILFEKYHITLSKELQESAERIDQAYFGTLRPGSSDALPTPKGH